MTDAEAETLRDLRAAVSRAANQLDASSPWTPALEILAEELEAGQPFFFKFALASSSRSMSDTPVAVE